MSVIKYEDDYNQLKKEVTMAKKKKKKAKKKSNSKKKKESTKNDNSDGTEKIVKEKIGFKIKNNGTGVPTEIDYGDLKEPSLSEVLMAGFKEEQAASKKEEEKSYEKS